MKVLIISKQDIQGGAFIAAYRAHNALRKNGVDSFMWVDKKMSNDWTVKGPPTKIAKPFDPNDLAQGIEWVLNAGNYSELCKNARDKVLKEFDSKVVAKKYITVFEKILLNKL